MLESLLQQTTIPILEQVTAFGQRRHQVLVGNIANIDTDDYKMRDLPVQDFERALQQAIDARKQNSAAKPHPLQTGSYSKEILAGLNPPVGSSASLGQGPFATQKPQNLKDFFTPELNVAKQADAKNVTFHDGSNRSIEEESMEMVKNASMQSFAIRVMTSQLNLLESVISERVI